MNSITKYICYKIIELSYDGIYINGWEGSGDNFFFIKDEFFKILWKTSEEINFCFLAVVLQNGETD